MEQRKKITELVDIKIETETWGSGTILFRHLKDAKIPDEDEFVGVAIRSGYCQGFGGNSEQDDDQYYHYPVAIVRRYRLESDDEFLKRLQMEEREKKNIEQRERNLYITLKAKYESE